MHRCLPVLLLLSMGCPPPKPIPGVVRPGPGEPFLESLPGPMPGFGPFDSYSDALMASCPLILSKPNATAGRLDQQDFQLRWRISNEYCGWLYYTPDHQYEMSMLTDQAELDPLNRWKSCKLPPLVSDRRYPSSNLKYIVALHNHPFENILSDRDIRFIAAMGSLHGFAAETQAGRIPISIIAYFSRSNDPSSPACDGFFEYIPLTGTVTKWTHTGSTWAQERIGVIEWINEEKYDFRRE